jgi:hypothetical protein
MDVDDNGGGRAPEAPEAGEEEQAEAVDLFSLLNPQKMPTTQERAEAIRQNLLQTTLDIWSNDEFFAEHFVKLSQGNDTVQEVLLDLEEDLLGDYKTLGLLEKGFGNLGALRVVTINFNGGFMRPYKPRRDIQGNCLDQAREAAISFYWQAVTGVLRRVRNNFELRLEGEYDDELNYKKFAVAIKRVSTIRAFHSGDALPWRSANTIMSALASLPSLENVTLAFCCDYKYPVACKFRGLTRLLKSPSLRSIEFSKIQFTSGVSRALLAAFEKGSFVTNLRFTDCFLGGRPSEDHTGTVHALVQALQRNLSVKSLSLTGNVFRELFYEGITSVILVNTTLVDLTLRTVGTGGGGRWLQPLFAAMRINSSLKSLNVDTFHLTDEIVCGALRDMLVNNSVLESLTLHFPESLDDTSMLSWRKTLPFIRDDATLKSLTISLYGDIIFDPHATPFCFDTVAMLEGNTTLECLDIKNSFNSPDAYVAVFEYLQPGSTLKTLRHSVFGLASMTEQEMNQVVSLVRKNYSLAVLDEGVSAHDKTGELGTLLRLNQVGRRYLIEDAASIAKGVEVLIGVSDDLGCLFYHLLENPTLCDIEHLHNAKSETGNCAHLNKRQRI